jgi:diguanylate cyclase (GGDEF)-like protein
MNNKEHNLPLEFVKKVKDAITKKEFLIGEVRRTSKDGHESWYQNSIMPILDDDGTHLGEVIVRYDITEKKSFEKLAITDGLTALYNRRYFNEILSREINRANRDKSILSFCIIDVDYFKKYNDAYGHPEGDGVLIAVANAIKSSLHRGSDFVFRLGGEEFGVIFSGLSKEEAFAFAEEIRANVEALNIPHTNSLVTDHITISLGLLVVNFENENVDENGFYTMADDALYQAKESGRNKVVIYENDDLEFF